MKDTTSRISLDQIYITRYIAAVIVVFYHFFTILSAINLPFFFRVHGYESVNYFFFLSGFIMVVAYKKEWDIYKKIHALNFFVRRIARLYPAYIAALFLLWIFYEFINSSIWSNFNLRIIPEILLVQSWIFKSSLNFPGWSLSVEFFFYLCFPLLLKVLINKSNLFLIILLATFFLLNFLIGKILIEKNVLSNIEYSPYVHLTTFTSGLITGIIYFRIVGKRLYNDNKLGLYGISIISFLFIYFGIGLIDHNNGWFIPTYSFFLLAFCIPSQLNTFWSHKIFKEFGNISYSIYILHYPLFLFYSYIVSRYQVMPSLLLFIGYFVFLNIGSYLLYLFIEKPTETYLKQRFLKKIAAEKN